MKPYNNDTETNNVLVPKEPLYTEHTNFPGTVNSQVLKGTVVAFL